MWRQARKAFQSMRRWQAPLFPVERDNLCRKAVLSAALSPEIPSATVSKTCASSDEALFHGIQAIQCGNADTVLVGGVEKTAIPPHFGGDEAESKNAMRGIFRYTNRLLKRSRKTIWRIWRKCSAENMAFGGKIWMNMLTKVWRKPAMHSNPAVYRRRYCRSSMTRGHFPSTKQCRTIPYSVMSNMQNHCF